MNAQQLKNSILQMAVQGKLVPQDPDDEPASVLLERIRREKEQLIKEGKIKKEKNPSYIFSGADNTPYEKVGNAEPVSIADEVPFEIPEGWEWCRLSDLTVKEVKRGKSPTYISSSGVLVFAQKCNVKAGGIDMSLAKFLDEKTLGKYPKEEFMQDYDIVVNSTGTGTMGRIGLFRYSDNPAGLPIVPDSHVTIVRLNHSVSVDYLLCCLQYYQPYLEEHGEGSTNQKELKPDTIKNLFIPLPPILEQERIANVVTGIEPYISAYGKKDAELAELNIGFPEQLKKSILQLAVQGKLAPQDPSDEPASVLLERIRDEKERLIKEGKIKRDKNESVIYRRDNSHYEKRDGKEICIDEEIPYELPENWCWCRLKSIASVFGGKRIPAGRKLTTDNTGHIYIRVSDMKEESVNTDNLLFVPNDIYPTIARYIINKEDIYITVAGTIGRVGKIPAELDGANLTENADRLVFTIINQNWLIQTLQSSLIQEQIAAATTQVGQPKLAIARIEQLLIPLPPIEEQERICRAIQSLMKIINTL